MRIKLLNLIISLLEKFTRKKKTKNRKPSNKKEQPEKGNDIYPLW